MSDLAENKPMPQVPEKEQGLLSVFVGALTGFIVGGPAGACLGITLVAAFDGGKYVSKSEDGTIEIVGIEHDLLENGIEGFALQTKMLIGGTVGSRGSIFAFFYDKESGREIETHIKQLSNNEGHFCVGEEFVCDKSVTEKDIDLFIPYGPLARSHRESFRAVVILSLYGDREVTLATDMDFYWRSENFESNLAREAGFESSEAIDAIVALAVAFIKADGVVDDKEKEEFKKIFQDIVPSDQRQSEAMQASLQNYFNSPVPVDEMIEILVKGLDDHEKRVVLAFYKNIAKSDGTIHDKETELFKKIQSAFSISD